VNCCNSIELRFDRENVAGDDYNCFWKYSFETTDPLCQPLSGTKEVILYADPAGTVEIPQDGGYFMYLTIPSDGVIYYRIIMDDDTCSIRSDTLVCDCAGCPAPSEYGQWFNVEVLPGGLGSPGNCGPDQCYVKHSIQLDPKYSCYETFQIRRIIDDVVLFEPQEYPIAMLSSVLQQRDTCIEKGEFYEIEIQLITYDPLIYDGSFYCTLRQTAYCDEKVFAGDPQEDKTCVPDCALDTFVVATDEKYKSQVCDGCELVISYKYRQACNGSKQDIQLTNISRRTLPGYPPDACNNCTEAAFMQEAIYYLLDENPMGFKKPDEGQCDTTWRIAQSNCWMIYYQYDISNNGDVDATIVRTPCESSCCVKPLLVCNTGREYVYDNLPSQAATVTCDPNATARVVVGLGDFFIPNGGGCHFSCEDLEGLADLRDLIDPDWDGDTIRVVVGSGGPARNSSDSITSSSLPRHVEMRVQQENEMLITEFWNSTVSDVKIGIYTLTGQLLEEQTSTVNKGIATLRINLADYASGAYLMTITVDNIVLKSGAFQIVK
jgi:hypothetical protein